MSVKQPFIWSFLIQFSFQAVGFVVSIILARILSPSEFGLIGMIAVFLNLGRTIVDGGLAASLIRSKNNDEIDLSTVFWINVSVGLVIYLLLFLAAPFISLFFKEDILTNIIKIYGISLVIGSFSVVQAAIYRKVLNFKIQFIVMTLALLVSGSISIWMALNDFGVMALVWKEIIFNTVVSILYWSKSSWRPKVVFDITRFKYHFSFGSKLTINDLVFKFFQDFYKILIGRYMSSYDLGLYTRAKSLEELPNGVVFSTINRVLYPLMAAYQTDNDRLISSYRIIIRLVFFVMIPLSFFLILVAEPLILFLLTEKWIEIVPFFQIMLVGGLFFPLASYLQSLLKVKGRSDLVLRITVFEVFLMLIGAPMLYLFGIYGLLWVLILVSFLRALYTGYITSKLFDYSLLQQFFDISKTLLATLITFFFMLGLQNNFSFPEFSLPIYLMTILFIFVIIYIGLSYVLKNVAFFEVFTLIKNNGRIKA